MTELAILARDVGVHERTLRRAVTEGSVRALRPTARTLTMPMCERRYTRRRWPLLSALRGALRTEPNVRFALLVGSMAAGRDTPTSDVDLLVDLRDASLDRLLDLSSKLASLVGRPVDVHRLEDVEADPSMFATALADGRVLVDREGRWPRLQEQRSSVERNSARQQETRARAALAGIDRLLGT